MTEPRQMGGEKGERKREGGREVRKERGREMDGGNEGEGGEI